MLKGLLTTFFELKEHNTSIRTECLAGLTAFFTISYIVFLTPTILSTTGMNAGAVFTATCLVVGISTLLVAVIANIPITIAPAIALTVFFAYIVVDHHGYHWQDALGMVFISGLIFFLLSLTQITHYLVKSIPQNMSIAIVVGLSLLIAMVALKDSNIIKVDPRGFIELGKLNSLEAIYVFVGAILIVTLDYYQVRGAILIVILGMSLLDASFRHPVWQGMVSLPPSLTPTFLKMRFSEIDHLEAYKEVFSFFLIALFDATGTLIGLLNQPLFKNKEKINHTIERGLIADSFGATIAGTLGTSSTSPFIESAAAIEAGGRTGLASVITGILFIGSLFLFPITKQIHHSVVGAVLLYIACCMMREVSSIKSQDMTEFVPAVVTIVMIPYTFSIANGIGLGIITYTLLKLLTKKYRELNPMLVILSLVFLIYFFVM